MHSYLITYAKVAFRAEKDGIRGSVKALPLMLGEDYASTHTYGMLQRRPPSAFGK
jgi:hypothetical protein